MSYQEQYEKLLEQYNELSEKYIRLKKKWERETVEVANNLTRHSNITKELNEIYEEKNRLYGDSFTDTVNRYGLIASLTRMADKWARIESMVLQGVDNDGMESLKDNLQDLSNYLIMTLMVLEMEETQ